MRRRSTRGFSLIEVTVAIGVVALMVVATSSLLQRLPVSGREVRDEDLALKIARAKIETLRVGGYDTLPASGSFTDSLLNSLASSSAAVTVTTYSAKTKRVDVSVSWRGAGLAMRSLSLTTLMTQASGLP